MNRDHRWGLTVRMAASLLLLGVLYIGLGYAVAILFGAFVGPTGTGHLVGIGVTVLALAASQYYFGPKIALRAMGGRLVTEAEYPELYAQVRRLARQADVETPQVAVADSRVPNAFATGRRGEEAIVCVTEGLLDRLDDDQREAVLAHEIAHVVNRDYLLMTVVAALVGIAGWFVRWGFLFGDGGDGGGGEQPYLWVGYLLAIGVWVGGFLVSRVISRYREFAADRGAVYLTGQPSALASALVEIEASMSEVPETDLRDAERVNALLAAEVSETRLGKWFSTHPAVERRVERLEDLEREFEG